MVKIVDFGLASCCDVEQYLYYRCGTPGFVAPEIICSRRDDNRKFTSKCDVFSTGVIFFFMLTGKLPFEGNKVEEVLKSNQHALINFDIKELKLHPKNTISLLKLMLEIDPQLRPSASECLSHPFFRNQISSE